MDARTIAQFTGLAPNVIEKYLGYMSAAEIYADDNYVSALRSLDKAYLERTLPLVRKVYENHLGEFTQEIGQRYGINSEPMSAYTLGNWVVGVLQYPEHATRLLEHHKRIPGEAVGGSLLELLHFLDDLPEGKDQWQQALCLLAFPLMNS